MDENGHGSATPRRPITYLPRWGNWMHYHEAEYAGQLIVAVHRMTRTQFVWRYGPSSLAFGSAIRFEIHSLNAFVPSRVAAKINWRSLDAPKADRKSRTHQRHRTLRAHEKNDAVHKQNTTI